MDYILKKKLNTVNSYLAEQDYCVCNESIKRINEDYTLMHIAHNSWLFNFGKDHFIAIDSRGNSQIFNTYKNSKDNRFKIDYASYPYFTFYEFENKPKEGIYDHSQQKILFETEEWLGRKIIGEHIYGESEGKIACRIVQNGEILWLFDLSQFGEWHSPTHGTRNYEVKDFVGGYNNQLLVQLSNFKLIGIDVNTGKLVNEINLGELYATEMRNFLSDHSKMFIDDANGKIIWLTSASLIHINIEDFSSKLVCNYFHEDYTKVRRFEATTLYKSKLYFTGKKFREGGDPDWVGVMEPNTGEILWEYLIENGNLYEAPQVTDTHLYVRDTISKTLYIFE